MRGARASGRGPSHGLRPRPGALLPDGPAASARGGRARSSSSAAGPWKPDRSVRLYRFRKVAERVMAASRDARGPLVRGVYRRRQCRPRRSGGSPPRVPRSCVRRPHPGGTRTRSSSFSPCFSTCTAGRRPGSRRPVSFGRRCPAPRRLPPRGGNRVGRASRRRTPAQTAIARSPTWWISAGAAEEAPLKQTASCSADSLDEPLPGSNNWAMAGRARSTAGRWWPNDMHLGLGLPNTWYRAALVFEDERRQAPRPRRSGVTLPGAPFVVAGSNGDVAWSFTNPGGDWSDLVLLEPGEGPDTYRTPEGDASVRAPQGDDRRSRPDSRDAGRRESTVWGPVFDSDHRGRRRVHAWVAHEPGGVNLGSRSSSSCVRWTKRSTVAHCAGSPTQNLVCADRSGRIAWTLLGRIPRRVGFDGSVPSSWADGSRTLGRVAEPRRVPSSGGAARAGSSGQPTRASSTAKTSRVSATEATTSAPERARSGTVFAPCDQATEGGSPRRPARRPRPLPRPVARDPARRSPGRSGRPGSRRGRRPAPSWKRWGGRASVGSARISFGPGVSRGCGARPARGAHRAVSRGRRSLRLLASSPEGGRRGGSDPRRASCSPPAAAVPDAGTRRFSLRPTQPYPLVGKGRSRTHVGRARTS